MGVSTMFRKSLLGAVVAFSALGWGTANATVYTLDPTQNNAGNTVAASADVTVSGDLLTIVLTNLSPSLSAANQALSDFLINFSTDITGVSSFTQDGSRITVNSDGSTTPFAGPPTRWDPFIRGGGNLYLTALGNGSPSDMIAPDNIGSPNSSVDNFNPYIDTTATFTMLISGASNLTISGVSFSFGTNPDEFSACVGDCGGGGGGQGGVPEPASWALMIVGFGGVGAMLRQRRRHLAFAG
jgi:hypothetical protein